MQNPLYTRARPILNQNGIITGRHRKVQNDLRSHYAYAIPNERAIRALVNRSPIVEVGAGSGYWAWLIEQEGGAVRAFDKYPPGHPSNQYVSNTPFTEVAQAEETIAATYPDHTLFLCWPDDFNQETGWSDRALERYLDAGGTTLALVTEGEHMAAGSERLHKMAERKMDRVEWIGLPNFPHLHDHLRIYKAI